MKKILFTILIFTQGLYLTAFSQTSNQDSEITIYVITSVSPINWSNPSTLFKSSVNCLFKSAIQKNYYMIGHTIARINSPLQPAPTYWAMCGDSNSDKVKLVLGKKVGLGVLGSTMSGHLESEKNIKRGLKLYSKRKKVAYIKFKINAQSNQRITQFMNYYEHKTHYSFAPYQMYNGALWPRYENEGAGCSAFGISLLDVAEILPSESEQWIVDVNIPMNLIGGEFNNNKKVKFRDILKTKSWYIGTGTIDVDYVNYKVYDPSLIFNWIISKRNQNDSIFQPDEENGIPGVVIDMRNAVINKDEPILKHRTDSSNLFIKHYYNKIHNMNPILSLK